MLRFEESPGSMVLLEPPTLPLLEDSPTSKTRGALDVNAAPDEGVTLEYEKTCCLLEDPCGIETAPCWMEVALENREIRTHSC